MARTRQIAVLCPGAWEPYRQFIQGVTDFTAGRHDCELNISPDASQLLLPNLKGWPGDGVIAHVYTPEDLRMAKSFKIPVVNISAAMQHCDLPSVICDSAAVGRLAAEHLLQTGLRRFAYYGLCDRWFSSERKRGFVERLKEEGFEASILESPSGYDTLHPWDYWSRPLDEWLKTLKPPLGLMAVHDLRAIMVVSACQRIGLRVPDDVAVLGVDNEEMTCQFCRVPLSSVARNERLAGFEAMALLNRLITKKKVAKDRILVPPDRVVKRRSTDLVAVDDPRLAEVVRYVREHIGQEFNVENIARTMQVSRRWLEHRFQEAFRCTPLEYISRIRVERAKELLAGHDRLSIEQISRQCGFSGQRQFGMVFRRFVGTTPTGYKSVSAQPSAESRKNVGGRSQKRN